MPWNSGCSGRGSYDILSSCLSTLIICTYSTFHPNIPPAGEKRYHPTALICKLKWVMAGLLMPQVIFCIAIQECVVASEMAKVWNKYTGNMSEKDDRYPCECAGHPQSNYKATELETPTQPIFQDISQVRNCSLITFQATNEKSILIAQDFSAMRIPTRSKWTIVHGYYAVMGGFAIDTSLHDNPTCSQLILDANMVTSKLLCGPGRYCRYADPHAILCLHILPDVDLTVILDKSKADAVAKLLLMIQVLWFCANCIARYGAGLPLSMLETFTLIHAFTSICTYLIWWEKPLNIGKPTMVMMNSELSSGSDLRLGTQDWRHSEFFKSSKKLRFQSEMSWYTVLSSFYTPSNVTNIASNMETGEKIKLLLTTIYILLCIGTNSYLVEEGLRQLFDLPPEAFLTLSWPSYIPHIS